MDPLLYEPPPPAILPILERLAFIAGPRGLAADRPTDWASSVIPLAQEAARAAEGLEPARRALFRSSGGTREHRIPKITGL